MEAVLCRSKHNPFYRRKYGGADELTTIRTANYHALAVSFRERLNLYGYFIIPIRIHLPMLRFAERVVLYALFANPHRALHP